MSAARYEAVVFDLDGTLVDSTADIAAAINRGRADCGLRPLDADEIRTHLGDGASVLIQRCFPEEPAPSAELLERFRDDYRRNCLIETRPYEGVKELLPVLARSFCLGVLTNKDRSMSISILEGLGLLPFFDSVVGGDGPCLKPCPDGLLLILERAGVSPAAALMVGDHHTDLEAARHAGVASAFCEYGYGSIGRERADHRLRSFSDLEQLLLHGHAESGGR